STYSEDLEMSSEHLIIFAAISLQYSNLEYILEIGTYDGFTTAVLANLFPKSNIITIDLEDKDQLFIDSYNRNDKYKRNNFISQRNKLLSSFDNIKFIQKNSLTITRDENLLKRYGLIWIDGAHGYPVVCSDITNAINLAMKDTIIMCDDVWKDNRYDDSVYNSKASFQTLEAFEKAGLLENNYFFKRIGKRYLNQIKYISYSKIKS
ncbi:class I SAM-dependent methyltransferase, partial [Prochlorococcus sp. AH-716-J21]|nr:class I SAM-dependent methyltransferase [Prochlorococcus sp. AH-716-J21]